MTMKQQSYWLCTEQPPNFSGLLQIWTSKYTKRKCLQFNLHSCLFLDVCPQVELNNRQTVSLEIAKALEETRQQKGELQTQVSGIHVTHHLIFTIIKKRQQLTCVTHTFTFFYASVPSTAVAEGIMVLGWDSVHLYVHPSIHPSIHPILRTPWDHFVKFGTNVHCDSWVNCLVAKGQRSRSLWLDKTH